MRRPSGFTLVELLVVITIIAILISLLLPAVQSAREAARQAQCQNNLKQVGLASLNYEATHGCLPPSINVEGSETGSAPATYPNLRRNWAIAILPYLEQQPLYDRFDLTQAISDSVNLAARSTSLPMMLCPSDDSASQRAKCNQNGGSWARGNYGANGGQIIYPPKQNAGQQATGVESNWAGRYVCGVMGIGQALPVEGIRDGTSNTTMFLELKSGLIPEDIRGTWAMGLAGASSVWCYACWSIYHPNSCNAGDDDIPYVGTMSTLAARAQQECMTPSGGSASLQAGTRSRHPGGVMSAFADGSVHFISNYIESGWWNGGNSASSANPTMTNFLTWQRLNVSSDAWPINNAKF